MRNDSEDGVSLGGSVKAEGPFVVTPLGVIFLCSYEHTTNKLRLRLPPDP